MIASKLLQMAVFLKMLGCFRKTKVHDAYIKAKLRFKCINEKNSSTKLVRSSPVIRKLQTINWKNFLTEEIHCNYSKNPMQENRKRQGRICVAGSKSP